MTPLPESRATARRREENVFGVLDAMGRAKGGRVRSRKSRGIPQKKSCSLNSGLGTRVLIICNTTTGEIGAETCFDHCHKTHENPTDFNTFAKPMLWLAFGAHLQPWCSWFSLLACPCQKTHENLIDFNNS